MRWYRKISSAPEGDFSHLLDALEWFSNELETLRPELEFSGSRLAKASQRIPGLSEYAWRLLQELENIFRWAEIMEMKTLTKMRKFYLENYPRALSERQANQMADGSQEVIDMKLIILEIALVRNQYLALTKGIEYLHYQVTNLTKLHAAGVEDATFL